MFQPIEGNVSIYKKIVAQIQDMIMKGELKRGDRLPPERQLAELLGVGRPALKQAISALEVMGIIRSRQGDGNYITAESVDIITPLAIQFYLNEGKMDDILEFRYIIEVQMASLAAMKITEKQIAEFQRLMDEIRENVPDRAELKIRQHYNNAFHFQVVRLCSNRLIESIYTGIMDLIGEQIFQTDGVGFYKSHMKIFEAIRDRDPKRAAYYMADHFQKKFPNYQHYREFYSLLESDSNSYQ